MKTINFKLSERLNEKWLLDNRDTEYVYHKSWTRKENIFENKNHLEINWFIKTLTFEEAIEFLPLIDNSVLDFAKLKNKYRIWYPLISEKINFIHWKTLLEAIEKMIEYLLDNDLLWK